ncbi:Bifunctional protein FolD protein [Baekduia alba]|uniref:bifunctional methylenetetrahydrofolate dehydrogenase/methenyltetrahydrofolate cyclohydrolase FolD n=1 Tax=Baekduia alba TaxID=2997333 RepID=UPI002341B8C5|nr:bifunctional methylenetetrahydrofolate dehydrogenase/methenyltetrahydrofolate cyclohydrolase FolD [Baekduia alba]WCB93855.1 Bifunctional protein FolD protein [Baekduia alba]
MSAEIIDGRAIAAKVREEVARDVERFVARHGRPPGLATILVGDDPASAIYINGKQKASREVGIEPFHHQLPADTPTEEVEALIERLNADDAVSGILCQLPVPDHLDGVHLTGLIDARKDVDGLTPLSAGYLALGRAGLRPCTPAGVMVLLDEAGVALEGQRAVVVGRSNLFGKPMAQLLLGANATVTTAHSRTQDLPGVCREADVLIVAVGRDRMVKADWVKPGAVVIDVGMNRSDDGLHGDVDFEDVKDAASWITPVPGGVGPMTIAMLLRNTLNAAELVAREGAPA